MNFRVLLLNAFLLISGGSLSAQKIGYVNKTQSPAFNRWLNHYSITACIERINGTKARPLIYIYGRVHFANVQQIAA